jgi:5-(carboxyamino)imidazole ribonucleotide mutase
LPVIGVPVVLSELEGLDSLLSIVQMPNGVPVATVGTNKARNAALLAVRILGTQDEKLQTRMQEYQAGLRDLVIEKDAKLNPDA